MKRNKQTEGTLQYKNTSGTLFINGEFIKRNETFFAFPQEIPKSFMDTIVCIEDVPVKEVEPDPETGMEYILVDRGNGWFDIVDQDGKKVNETGMRKAKAEETLLLLQQ